MQTHCQTWKQTQYQSFSTRDLNSKVFIKQRRASKKQIGLMYPSGRKVVFSWVFRQGKWIFGLFVVVVRVYGVFQFDKQFLNIGIRTCNQEVAQSILELHRVQIQKGRDAAFKAPSGWFWAIFSSPFVLMGASQKNYTGVNILTYTQQEQKSDPNNDYCYIISRILIRFVYFDYHQPTMQLEHSREQLFQDSSSKSTRLDNESKPVLLPLARDVTCIATYENTLYLGSSDSKVFTYHLQLSDQSNSVVELKDEKSFYPHCNSVHFICVSQQFLIVVPFQQQQLIRIWGRQSLQILHGYKGHEKQISRVIFLSDKTHIASVSHDGTVRIWAISDKFEFDTEQVKFVNKYPLLALEQIDGETVVFGGDDCFITVWNWRQRTISSKLFGHPGSVLCLAGYFPYLLSAGGDSKLKIWKIEDEAVEQSLKSGKQVSGEKDGDGSSFALRKIKEISGNVSQYLFSYKLSKKELLIIDSRGNLFIVNSSLSTSIKSIPLVYSERIRSMLVWERLILFVSNNSKGKGQLKVLDLSGDSEKNSDEPFVKTTLVDIKTKNTIESEAEINMVKKQRDVVEERMGNQGTQIEEARQ